MLTIGRRIGSTILIDDPAVALDHAMIVRVGLQHVLINRENEHCTLVNGRILQEPRVLTDGDDVVFGQQCFGFRAALGGAQCNGVDEALA
jgi:pSer/pThr/pTyr-binding forkhead associated (FHA) protein